MVVLNPKLIEWVFMFMWVGVLCRLDKK